MRERAPDVIVEDNVDGEGVREVDEAALQSAWEESRVISSDAARGGYLPMMSVAFP